MLSERCSSETNHHHHHPHPPHISQQSRTTTPPSFHSILAKTQTNPSQKRNYRFPSSAPIIPLSNAFLSGFLTRNSNNTTKNASPVSRKRFSRTRFREPGP
ncbi:hypothetical protein S245_014260 [Arachis hypogaea]